MRKIEVKVFFYVLVKVIIGLVFDCVDKMVYWMDIIEFFIGRVSLYGGELIIIVR